MVSGGADYENLLLQSAADAAWVTEENIQIKSIT
jgi:hypothetical protein